MSNSDFDDFLNPDTPFSIEPKDTPTKQKANPSPSDINLWRDKASDPLRPGTWCAQQMCTVCGISVIICPCHANGIMVFTREAICSRHCLDRFMLGYENSYNTAFCRLEAKGILPPTFPKDGNETSSSDSDFKPRED